MIARTYHIIKNGMTFKNICRHLWGAVSKGGGRLRVFPTFRCNLNCSYCANMSFLDRGATKKEIDGKTWIEIINRCGRDVDFSGGEATLHKDIWYILQNIKPSLQVKLCTNLTFNIDEFLAKVKRPVYFCASYHPDSGPLQKTIDRILKLRRAGKWDNYGNIHTVGSNDKAVGEFAEAGIKLTAKRLIPQKKKENTKKVLCKHYDFLIAPDGRRCTCYSKMCRGLGMRENLVTDKLEGTPIITECNDYPYCADCDFSSAKMT